MVVRNSALHFYLVQQFPFFFAVLVFVSYSIRFLTFYVKFLTAISHCLFSFVYFADSELTSSAGSSTVLCAVWIMESSRKNRTQVCLLFYIVVLLKIDCVIVIIMWHYLKHSQGEAFKICIKDLTYFIYYLIICCYWLGLAGCVCFGVICCSELMNAGQTLLALRLWPGLILTLLMVSQWIKTEPGTALYLTPSPQNHIGDTLSLQMSSLTSSWKVRVCECFCLCLCLFVSVLCNKGTAECIQEGKLWSFSFILSSVNFESRLTALSFYTENSHSLSVL